jgi:thiamine biosynthesis lipoprotein
VTPLLLLLAAPEPKLVYRSHHAMGSQITITAFTAAEAEALAAFDEAFAEFDRLDKLHTVWLPDSDVSRVNAKAGVEAVAVSADTIDIVAKALELSRLTKGKFDVTFGALSGLWKFDHDQDDKIPPQQEIDRRLPYIGWEMVKLDRSKGTIALEKAGMKMHLGGIGKGFAVDHGAAILRRRGILDFMVQAGGDLYVAGHRGGRNWNVGIRDPRGPPNEFFAAAEVTDATFSTSGDYERFFIQDGKRYHHILDPDVGRPAMTCRSVTIMAPDATTAEGLSKGVFILGPKEGLLLIESVPGAAAVIVDAANEVHVSKRLQGKLKILRPPTP